MVTSNGSGSLVNQRLLIATGAQVDNTWKREGDVSGDVSPRTPEPILPHQIQAGSIQSTQQICEYGKMVEIRSMPVRGQFNIGPEEIPTDVEPIL
jgi:hypothetical protein